MDQQESWDDIFLIFRTKVSEQSVGCLTSGFPVHDSLNLNYVPSIM